MLPFLVGSGDRLLPFLLRLFGWRSRWVETSRGRLHYFEIPGRGEGTPIVLVHGLGSRAADWASLVWRLRPVTRRILIPDLPGHGWTPGDAPSADDLQVVLSEALDALLPEPAYVIGNSMGGLVAVRMALQSPDRVLGLLLLSPAGAPMEETEVEEIRGIFAVTTHLQAVTFIDRLFGRRMPLRHLLAAGLLSRLRRPSVRAILAGITPADGLTVDEVRSLRMPIWFVWGGSDHILPARHLAWYRAALPDDAEIETPEEYGHSPFADHPTSFAKQLLALLGRLEARLRPRDAAPPG